MNRISTTLFIVISLFAVRSATAVPELIDNAEVKLAMMEISRQALADDSTASKDAKKPVIQFSKNCLNWNARQINSKADKFAKSINKYSRQYRVDSELVKSVITVESCFKTRALSSAGAQGLMQLIPATAKRFGVSKSYNPEQNIRGGIKYLKFLIDRYKGDLIKVIAAYNAGEGKVDKHKGIPPYKETQQYVKNVLKIYALLNPKAGRVYAVYYLPKTAQKPGRHGWRYNRVLAPHLYKK